MSIAPRAPARPSHDPRKTPSIPVPINPAQKLTADDLRGLLVSLFEQSKPLLAQFHDYCQRAAALSEKYHEERFKEKFPAIVPEELSLLCTLDARETPTTCDNKLAQFPFDTILKRIIFDRRNTTYYLFV